MLAPKGIYVYKHNTPTLHTDHTYSIQYGLFSRSSEILI